MTGNGQAVATVMCCVVHDLGGREPHSEQDDQTKHRREKRMEVALRNDLGAGVGGRMIPGVDGLYAHELYPLRGVGANGEF